MGVGEDGEGFPEEVLQDSYDEVKTVFLDDLLDQQMGWLICRYGSL